MFVVSTFVKRFSESPNRQITKQFLQVPILQPPNISLTFGGILKEFKLDVGMFDVFYFRQKIQRITKSSNHEFKSDVGMFDVFKFRQTNHEIVKSLKELVFYTQTIR